MRSSFEHKQVNDAQGCNLPLYEDKPVELHCSSPTGLAKSGTLATE